MLGRSGSPEAADASPLPAPVRRGPARSLCRAAWWRCLRDAETRPFHAGRSRPNGGDRRGPSPCAAHEVSGRCRRIAARRGRPRRQHEDKDLQHIPSEDRQGRTTPKPRPDHRPENHPPPHTPVPRTRTRTSNTIATPPGWSRSSPRGPASVRPCPVPLSFPRAPVSVGAVSGVLVVARAPASRRPNSSPFVSRHGPGDRSARVAVFCPHVLGL